MVSTMRHHTFALMQAMQYLYTLTIATAEVYATLFVLFGTHLHIHIIQALLLGECTYGHRHHTLLGLCEQIHLSIGARDDIAYVVKLECHRDIVRSHLSSRLAISYEATIQVSSLIQLIRIGWLEVSSSHLGELRIVALRHLGTQLQTACLSHHSYRLPHLYIGPIGHKELLQISADRRCYRSATLGHALSLPFVSRLCRLVVEAYLLKLLSRDYLIAHQALRALIFGQRCLVGKLSFEQRVTILQFLGRDTRQALIGLYSHTLNNGGIRIVEHTSRSGYHYRFATLRHLYMSRSLDDTGERSHLYSLYLQACRLSLLLAESDALTMIVTTSSMLILV